jgi:hypothetical protein
MKRKGIIAGASAYLMDQRRIGPKKKQGMLGRFGLCLRLERGSTPIQHTWNAVETAVVDDER